MGMGADQGADMLYRHAEVALMVEHCLRFRRDRFEKGKNGLWRRDMAMRIAHAQQRRPQIGRQH